MKAERIVLSLVALVIGLLVAGGAFYLYQATKNPSPTPKQTTTAQTTATPTPANTNLFQVDAPSDEAVVDSKTVTISGKTLPDATIIAHTETADQVAKPTANGDFTFTVTIPSDSSYIHITAVFGDGSEKTITRTITYSTESF